MITRLFTKFWRLLFQQNSSLHWGKPKSCAVIVDFLQCRLKLRWNDIRVIARLLGTLFYGICLIATAAPANKKPIIPIQQWQTPQGTPVYFVRTAGLPIVDIQVIFTAGSAYDSSRWGIASITAATLNEGTQQHNADQIAEAFDQAGAQYNNQTTRDVSIIALRSLSDPQYFNPALQIFKEILSQANFPDSALARIKQQTLTAIREQAQDPSAVGADTFYQNLYPNHPYGHATLGAAETVNALTKAQVQDFYRQYYVSRNAKLVLVGNLDRSQAEKIAEQLMGSLPVGTATAPLAMENTPAAAMIKSVVFPSQQTTIITGQLGIERQSPQFFPLTVGNYLLGQMPLNSLLFNHVRNQQGLVYDVYSSFILMTYRGPFIIMLQTRAAEKNRALDIAQQTLREFVTQGLDPQQLQAAKENMVNHFPLSLSTNEKITAMLVQMAINQRPLDYFDTYQASVNAVTAAQVKQAFQALINPDKLLTVAVGK